MKNKHYHTIVIGSGCAGFNAADWLYDFGVKDIVILTEGINMGTSRNAGSDKQTYYKLTLAGSEPDSVFEMAQTLFDGGGVHGDTALAEAAGSAQAFMKLVNLGIPFPTNQYGEFVGYKTDHDPRQRATSCGPLTSKLMTEALERSVKNKNIPVHDHMQVIQLVQRDGRIAGLFALNKTNYSYTFYSCNHIILATGGPAGVYSDVVYPESQTGGTGLALEIGAKACNLQEWQYGLASVDFRWNVSGTYQQVLPKYISIGPEGDEKEFLPEYFNTPGKALDNVFLKGYQWPFDVRKINGSSQIDLCIAEEIKKGRFVYMDFRRNPKGLEEGFGALSEEACRYLDNSGALFGRPIDRLAKMNPRAIEIYRANGIDLYKEPLKVAVCAQHCNGGIAVDANWESSIKGLYAAGEAAGTFGVYRPGGSALNSAQVGSYRAARHIAKSNIPKAAPIDSPYNEIPCGNEMAAIMENRLNNQRRMSQYAAYMRETAEMKSLYDELLQQRKDFFSGKAGINPSALPELYKSYDILITQISVLSAMVLAAQFGSRGGALVNKETNAGGFMDKCVVTQGEKSWAENVRPLLKTRDWFENVWKETDTAL